MDTILKTCFKCGECKTATDFYSHSGMSSGLLGKCKECTKKDVRERYALTREQRAAYERKRFADPDRKAKIAEYQKKRRARDPVKDKARSAVSNALRDGRLVRQGCEVCGDKAQAHHDDYTKPLDVRWLCFRHHREHGHGQVVVSDFVERKKKSA